MFHRGAVVKETVAAFRARTGLPYDPPQSLTPIAKPLGENDACPTLFRFPGPCGMLDHFLGTMERIAPVPDGELWAAAAPKNGEAAGAIHFGTFALLEPLRFAMCATRDAGIYVGVNRPVEDPSRAVWIPPSKLVAPIPWDTVRDADEARAHLGSAADREGREARDVMEALTLYLDELTSVAKAGVPDPAIRWCDRPPELRRRTLDEFGIPARWTGVADRV
jgi:hypothetical protein